MIINALAFLSGIIIVDCFLFSSEWQILTALDRQSAFISVIFGAVVNKIHFKRKVYREPNKIPMGSLFYSHYIEQSTSIYGSYINMLLCLNDR